MKLIYLFVSPIGLSIGGVALLLACADLFGIIKRKSDEILDTTMPLIIWTLFLEIIINYSDIRVRSEVNESFVNFMAKGLLRIDKPIDILNRSTWPLVFTIFIGIEAVFFLVWFVEHVAKLRLFTGMGYWIVWTELMAAFLMFRNEVLVEDLPLICAFLDLAIGAFLGLVGPTYAAFRLFPTLTAMIFGAPSAMSSSGSSYGNGGTNRSTNTPESKHSELTVEKMPYHIYDENNTKYEKTGPHTYRNLDTGEEIYINSVSQEYTNSAMTTEGMFRW